MSAEQQQKELMQQLKQNKAKAVESKGEKDRLWFFVFFCFLGGKSLGAIRYCNDRPINKTWVCCSDDFGVLGLMGL